MNGCCAAISPAFFSYLKRIGVASSPNTLPLPQLMGVMLRLFAISPWDVRRGLVLGAPNVSQSIEN
jgi:hypothetical protein